ncbi:MAG: cation transporter [Acidobacteria bacterium]|nr:cation transporter [Acidobacteriota bacterium]
MKIEVLYFEGCPNHRPAVKRVKELLKEMGLKAEVIEVNVPNEATARRVGFLGSPTIRINGLDVEPPARSSTQFGMMCRTYSEGGRREGMPSRELIRQALKIAQISEEKLPYEEEIMEEKKERTLAGGVMLAAVVASLCCVVPLLFAGAGVTAIVIAEKFAVLRPYMLAVTGLLLLAGFYFAYRPAKVACEPGSACATPTSRKRARLAIWFAAGFAGLFALSPYWSAALIRSSAREPNVSALQAAGVPVEKATLHISGMVCEACAASIEKDLRAHKGVRFAQVRFSESAAEVEYDPSQVSLPQIQGVIEKAGYQVVEAGSDLKRKG